MKSMEAAEAVREATNAARLAGLENIPAIRFDPERDHRALSANRAGHVLRLPSPIKATRDGIVIDICDALEHLNPARLSVVRDVRTQLLRPSEWTATRVERLFEGISDDLAELCEPEVRQRLKVDIAAGAPMTMCPLGVNEMAWRELTERVPATTIRKRLWSALADLEIRRSSDGGEGSATRLRGGPRRFRSDDTGAGGVGPAARRGVAG